MITIHDIARETGVSPNTVARILAGRRGRPYNEAKVLNAAKKYGYIRNQQAANLRSGRSNLIGVIVPTLQNPHYPAFYQRIHDIALDHGYHILLSSTFGRVEEERQALHMFEMNRVAGVIVNTAEGETDEECDALLESFVKRAIPVIVLGRTNRGLPIDESLVKNVDACAKAVSYLHRTGHSRIAFICGPLATLSAQERLKGYQKGLSACKLPSDPALILHGEFTMDSGATLANVLLQLPERPTAIVAASDLMAIGAMQAIQAAGLKVPGDIAVTGFGDNLLSEVVTPKLTSVRTPTQQIARDCVQLLLERIASGKLTPPKRLIYEAELIIRESA